MPPFTEVLQSLQDLHIIQFDVVVAKEDFVSLRYTAEGTHTGEPHNGIRSTGQHAQWTAQGSFIMVRHLTTTRGSGSDLP